MEHDEVMRHCEASFDNYRLELDISQVSPAEKDAIDKIVLLLASGLRTLGRGERFYRQAIRSCRNFLNSFEDIVNKIYTK